MVVEMIRMLIRTRPEIVRILARDRISGVRDLEQDVQEFDGDQDQDGQDPEMILILTRSRTKMASAWPEMVRRLTSTRTEMARIWDTDRDGQECCQDCVEVALCGWVLPRS